jgi:hypothetical protein
LGVLAGGGQRGIMTRAHLHRLAGCVRHSTSRLRRAVGPHPVARRCVQRLAGCCGESVWAAKHQRKRKVPGESAVLPSCCRPAAVLLPALRTSRQPLGLSCRPLLRPVFRVDGRLFDSHGCGVWGDRGHVALALGLLRTTGR